MANEYLIKAAKLRAAKEALALYDDEIKAALRPEVYEKLRDMLLAMGEVATVAYDRVKRAQAILKGDD